MKVSSILAGVAACAVAVSATVSSAAGPEGSDAPSPAVVLLDQGWSQDERNLFHYTSQGSFFMPAAWLEALEDAEGGRFMAPENTARYGLIPDAPSAMNPYGWPIGVAIDTEMPDGIPQAGPTCAFCHTGQIDYHGRSVRIEGGQANIDFRAFGAALVQTILATATDPARRARFMQSAVRLGYPKARIEGDFQAMYRRVLEKLQDDPLGHPAGTPPGPGRLDAFNGIAATIMVDALREKSNSRPADAPVDYPYLWDMWLFDYTQYNASQRQPMGRDISEAMGQAGVVRVLDPDTGGLLPEPGRWHTTIRPRNLFAIRGWLDTLKPPPWPEDVLGRIDRDKAAQGRALFAQNCAGCHAIKLIKGTSNPTEWHVPVIPLDKIGTDPTHAMNFAGATFDATKLGLGKQTNVNKALFLVATAVKRQAYLDAGIPESEWPTYDGFGRKDVMDANPCGYKARPLVGVWATAPFLHNGAVPTVYDLLSETRPSTFVFGSTEYDPVKLGYVQQAGPGTMTLDTALRGNSNAGHWFTDEASRPGRIGRAFTDPEKFAIIEYLKAATDADYPTVQIDPPGPAPCASNPDWAKNRPIRLSN